LRFCSRSGFRADYEKRVFFPITHERGKQIIGKDFDPLVRNEFFSFHFIAHLQRETNSECVKRNEMKLAPGEAWVMKM